MLSCHFFPFLLAKQELCKRKTKLASLPPTSDVTPVLFADPPFPCSFLALLSSWEGNKKRGGGGGGRTMMQSIVRYGNAVRHEEGFATIDEQVTQLGKKKVLNLRTQSWITFFFLFPHPARDPGPWREPDRRPGRRGRLPRPLRAQGAQPGLQRPRGRWGHGLQPGSSSVGGSSVSASSSSILLHKGDLAGCFLATQVRG